MNRPTIEVNVADLRVGMESPEHGRLVGLTPRCSDGAMVADWDQAAYFDVRWSDGYTEHLPLFRSREVYK
jgi:hypothetical protein